MLENLGDMAFNSTKKFLDHHYLVVNRRLFNYLSSARLYVDHTEHTLSRTFGKQSQERDSFQQACRGKFDDRFAYRFFYKLRNYAQHVGMPVGRRHSRSALVEADGAEIETTEAHVAFVPQSLLETAASPWGDVVRKELESMTEPIDVRPLLREFSESLASIHATAVETFRPRLIWAGETFAGLAIGAIKKDNAVGVGTIDKGQSDSYHLDVEVLPFDVLKSVGLTKLRVRRPSGAV